MGGTELGTGYVSVVPETKGFSKKLDSQISKPLSSAGIAGTSSVEKALTGMSGNVTTLLNGTNKLAVKSGLAGAALVGVSMGIDNMMSKATATAKDYGSEVVLLQRMTGASARESSTWAAILGRYNVTGTKAALVVKSLSNAIASQSPALKSIGVQTQNLDGTNRTSMEVFQDLADRYKNAKDKTEVLAVATKTLGRGFASLLPALAGGKQGIADVIKIAEDAGMILTQENIDTVKAYNGALTNNKQALKGVEIQVGMATLPYETFKTKAIGGTFKALRDLNPELAKSIGATGAIAGDVIGVTGKVLIGLASWSLAAPVISGLIGQVAALGFTAVEASLAVQSIGSGVALESLWAAGGAMGAVATAAVGLSVVLGVGLGVAVNTGLQKLPAYQQGWNDVYATFDKFIGMDKKLSWMETMLAGTEGQAVVTSEAERAEARRNATVNAAVGITGSFTTATEAASGAVAQEVRDIHGLITASDSLSGATRTATDAQLASRLANLDAEAADRAVRELRKQGKTDTDEYARAVIAQTQAHLGAADAAQIAADAQHAENTALITGSATSTNLTGDYKTMSNQLNAATDKVAKLKAKLDTVPKSKRSKVEAEIKAAEKNVDKIKTKIGALKNKNVSVSVVARLTGSGQLKVGVGNGLINLFTPAALGGYFSARPGGHLLQVAEAGKGEFAIPDEQTPNSVKLLMQAAKRILPRFGGSAGIASSPLGSGVTQHITGVALDPDSIRIAAMQGVRTALSQPSYI